MCLCYAWLNSRGYRKVKSYILNIFQNQGEKCFTLHSILAVWQNSRLPGEWLGLVNEQGLSYHTSSAEYLAKKIVCSSSNCQLCLLLPALLLPDFSSCVNFRTQNVLNSVRLGVW